MKLIEKIVPKKEDNAVILAYNEFTQDFADIKDYVLGKNKYFSVQTKEKTILQLKIDDILYFEAVGELVFAYTEDQMYEVKMRLYQIHAQLSDHHIMRASKSFLINIHHIHMVRPALNGRLLATMDNNECIMISRQYSKQISTYILNKLY